MRGRRQAKTLLSAGFLEWEYPEDERRRRAALRYEIRDALKKARNSKWYAAKVELPISRQRMLDGRREFVMRALELRQILRASNRRHYREV